MISSDFILSKSSYLYALRTLKINLVLKEKYKIKKSAAKKH